ncbi:hypothetical protein HY995_01345 [Candidatus Micrarchaeota archaeon]|nr:hypothetical protein [Candidatus Micrarchaeota archaeon]MBI5176712.1 hypothetical protein [Candidatus Micrarchaeota archaeon]
MANESEIEVVEEILVWKLYRDGCWGKGHHSQTPLFTKGFPSHLGGKIVERVAEALLESGILYKHASGHEYQWSLNPARKEAVEAIVGRRSKRLGI